MKLRVRKRIFIGCEGASERSYSRWLQMLVDQRGRGYHIDTYVAGGGDPLDVVLRSVRKANEKERNSGRFHKKFIMLDCDRIGVAPERDARIPTVADGFDLLYQKFEHEACLLRHVAGQHNRMPGPGRGETELKRIWADYSKPSDALYLDRKLRYDELPSVARVGTGLANLLRVIGLIPAEL